MKKSFLFAAIAGLFLVSCSSDEFFGTTENTSKSNEIGFGMNVPNLTRATTGGAAAAQKLNNNFVVYGFKYFGTEPTSSTDVAKASKQQNVFTRYNVNYIGNEGTTQSNTKGWEYVGYNDLQGDLQTMKYWDYKADGYVFSAISGIGITPKKIGYDDDKNSVYNKGWKVEVPAGGSLSALYASARVPVTKTEGADKVYKYPETVDMTFYSMVTKVRFGIYETVPGYTVHIDKCYCAEDLTAATKVWHNTTTNFGINGNFYGPKANAKTDLTVTYYDNTTAVENRPKVEFDLTAANKETYKHFGTNMQAQPKIGETSAEATYDKEGGEYTYILPYQSLKETTPAQNELQLYVDFTLTAANGETIKVSHAKATVPTQYTQWKENFAYTYLFKISDNVNGTTGTPQNPDDPTEPWDPTKPSDPTGLYSITFDACVVNAEAGLTEEGVQETITSLTTPSITTYAQGTVVTANDEYTAGTVYYSANAWDYTVDPAVIKPVPATNSKVYEIIYNGTSAITENLVANYAKGNGVILVPVATAAATSVPLSDGTTLTFDDDCNSFTAAAGKNYAIVYTIGGKETFKVVRVAGTNTTTPDYTLSITSPTTTPATIKATESVQFKMTDGSATSNILGAATFFKVFNGAADVTKDFTIVANGTTGYIITPTADAVAAGANGVYTIKYGDEAAPDFTINSTYAISYTTGTTATVVKQGTITDNVILKLDGAKYPGAKVENEPAGITVTDMGAGVYNIAAGKDATVGTTTSLTIAGQPVSVKVVSYSLVAGTEVSKTIVWPETKATAADLKAEFDIQLMLDGAVSAQKVPLASSNTKVTEGGETEANGTFEVKPTASCPGGTAELTYENAKFTYTVNRYFLKSSTDKIDRNEATKLTFWLNGEQLNAATATVKVKKDGSEITTGFSLTSNGRDLTFGNVAETGTYRIEYYDEKITTVLGYEDITVK